MVGISFKKKLVQTVYLETYTSYKEYQETHKLRVPLDSFICYSMQKYCTSNFVAVRFVPLWTTPENEKVAFTIAEEEGESFNFLINEYEIPWTVALCAYPVMMAEDVIITGLCAVSRQICFFRNCIILSQEHDDGLLGFRHTCLQAPNETSVWTKFCEIQIIRAVQELLTNKDIKEVPNALVRFEMHMSEPVRIHNVYKVARHLKKESILKAQLEQACIALCTYAEQQRNDDQEINVQTQTTDEQQKNYGKGINDQKQAVVKQEKNVEQQSTNIEKQTMTEQQEIVKNQTNVGQKTSAEQNEVNSNTKHQTNTDPESNSQKQATVEKNAKQQSNVEKKANAKQLENQSSIDQHNNVEDKAKPEQQTNLEPDINAEQPEQGAVSEHQNNADQQTDDIPDGIDSIEGSSSSKRTSKSRKWKSQKKRDIGIDSSTKVEDLEVNHEFAEGPYLTLADLVLLPSYHIIIQTFGETQFESLMPMTYKWYKNLMSLPRLGEVFMSLMSHFNLKQLPIDNMTMPSAEEVSLYKCDPKRHNSKKRTYTKDKDIEKALQSITEGMELPISDNEFKPAFRWEDIPVHANPYSGYLPTTRVQRKSEQLENLVLAVLSMATDGDVIVDFCCGSGHLGIVLAYLLPKCTIILLENKEQSLGRAKERVQEMRLKNVYYYQCNLDFFIGEFDIGVGLHACGIATDLILDKCLKQNARFVLSPCCYGAIQDTCRMEYPRSKKFSSVHFKEYLSIAHAADQTHKEHPLAIRGARCMAIIDSDRARLAEEFGYTVKLMRLKPITCTPKNNLLIGIPTEK